MKPVVSRGLHTPIRDAAFAAINVLELAHLDHDSSNNDPDNLAWLCPTDHFRFDRGLIPLDGLKRFRAHQQRIKGKQTTLFMKDAGIKAAATRAALGIGRENALKAVATRRANQKKR